MLSQASLVDYNRILFPESSNRRGAATADPPLCVSWQWQSEEEPVDLSLDVDVYDIDMFANHASVVSKLHGRRGQVIWYVSVGSW